MAERALVLEAHHTTPHRGHAPDLNRRNSPGSKESLRQTRRQEELLTTGRPFDLVSTYLDSGLPITEGLIREIHKRLVEGVRRHSGTRRVP